MTFSLGRLMFQSWHCKRREWCFDDSRAEAAASSTAALASANQGPGGGIAVSRVEPAHNRTKPLFPALTTVE